MATNPFSMTATGATTPLRSSASTTPATGPMTSMFSFPGIGKMNAGSSPGSYTGPVSAGGGTTGTMGATGMPASPPTPASPYAYNPTSTPSTFSPASSPAAAATPDYGTNSGPGIMQQWFNERATGTDPGWEYGNKVGLTALDNAAAARGGYNSGAAEANDSNFMANSLAQREGQLDALAGGASAENTAETGQMVGLGMGLAGGEAGLGGAYDVAGANAMSGANNAGLQYGAQATMLPYMANQNFMNQMFGLGGLAALA